MIKKSLFLLLIATALGLVSWGNEGHSTVALVAENHLTDNAKAAVTRILGGRHMADISSWADDIKDSTTASWHFLNLKLGLSYADFTSAVKAQAIPNVYNSLLKLETDLTKPGTPAAQQERDLKFIVHLVGDVHQPMHISRKEDKGGGHIYLKFMGAQTNLHSLWDSELIKKDMKDYHQLVAKIDKATPQQIQQLQADDMMKWLYESYQISTTLYKEAEQNKNLGEDYYQHHIGIVENRLEAGGIRLAGVLNKLFK